MVKVSSKNNVAGPADPLLVMLKVTYSKNYSLKLSIDDATGKLGLKNWILLPTPSLHYDNAYQSLSGTHINYIHIFIK